MEHSAECCEKLAHFQLVVNEEFCNARVKMGNGGIISYVAFVCFLHGVRDASTPSPNPQLGVFGTKSLTNLMQIVLKEVQWPLVSSKLAGPRSSDLPLSGLLHELSILGSCASPFFMVFLFFVFLLKYTRNKIPSILNLLFSPGIVFE